MPKFVPRAGSIVGAAPLVTTNPHKTTKLEICEDFVPNSVPRTWVPPLVTTNPHKATKYDNNCEDFVDE